MKARYGREPLEVWEYLALETGPMSREEYVHLRDAWRTRWVPDPIFGEWDEMTWALAEWGPPPGPGPWPHDGPGRKQAKKRAHDRLRQAEARGLAQPSALLAEMRDDR